MRGRGRGICMVVLSTLDLESSIFLVSVVEGIGSLVMTMELKESSNGPFAKSLDGNQRS